MTEDIIASGGAEPATSAPDLITAIAAANDAAELADTKAGDAAEAAAAGATALFEINERWLGYLGGDPVLDLNNNNIATGAIYYNLTIDRIKVFNGTAWTVVVGKVHTGAGAPTNGDGADGDLWFRITPPTLYGPKAGGLWPAGLSMVGPAPWTLPVAWATTTAYVSALPASCVTYLGETYVCITAHTSTGSFDASKFVKIAASGTIPSTSITDSTAAGRAVLTAADAAAQRTALGLSAVAASGSYNDLTQSELPLCLPQGRLSLSTGVPVMTSTVAAAGTLYYTPCLGDRTPLWDGAKVIYKTFTEISQAATDATKSPAAVAADKVYDVFVWDDAGTLRISRGPAWTNDTTRGYTLTRNGGIWTNTSAITNGPAAGRGTWVGTVMSDAASKFNWVLGSSAAGGGAAILGVWNAYNRVRVESLTVETTASWTYNTNGWRSANNSDANRATFVSGASEDSYIAEGTSVVAQTGATGNGWSGVGIDSTSSPGGQIGRVNGNGSSPYVSIVSRLAGAAFGKHFVQLLENGGGITTSTWYGDASTGIRFSFMM